MATPVDLILARLAEVVGSAPRRSGTGWSARCPAHGDRKPSLSVGVGADGRVLLRCHAGCPISAIVEALGMNMSDLFPGDGRGESYGAWRKAAHPVGELARRRGFCVGAFLLLGAEAEGPIVALPMRDETGQVVGRQLRRGDGKPVRTAEGDAKSKTEEGGRNGLFFPCPLPNDGPVAVVEGVPDTLAGLSAGCPAIVGTAGANVGAVGRTALQLLLAGRCCVLFPHGDGGGTTWLADVGALLVNAQCEVRFVPADGKKGDLDERLRTAEREERPEAMRQLIESAVPWRTEVKAPVASWRIMTLADAYAAEEPLIQVVEGVIIRPSVIIVYGAPGVLKSFLVADVGMCVAGGIPWLPPEPPSNAEAKTTSRVPVLWLDFDNGRRRTAERVRALATAYGLPPATTPFHFVSMPSPWLDAASESSVSMLGDIVRSHDIGMCVIDNLGAVSMGADENSSDMIRVMAHLRRLAETTEAAIVLIHHQRKSGQFTPRAGESLRGHSSIEAAIDLALLCEREEGDNQVVVRSTKSRDVDVPPFGAAFSYEHKEGTNELVKAHFHGIAVEDTRSDQAVRKAVLCAVAAEHHINQSKLVMAVKNTLPGVGEHRIRAMAETLAANGKLNRIVAAHGAKIYSTPEPGSQVDSGNAKPP